MQSFTCSGLRSKDTPATSKRSALPLFLVALRFPCFATFAPQELATNAAVVDTLKIPYPTPPVPQVSTRCFVLTDTFVDSDRITSADPITSSIDSPLELRENKKVFI